MTPINQNTGIQTGIIARIPQVIDKRCRISIELGFFSYPFLILPAMIISYKVGNAGFNCISIWWQWLLPGTSENLMTNRCSVPEPADLCTQVTENITISYRRDCNLSVAEELQNQTRHYREINVVYLTACSSPFFVISGSVTWCGVISGLWHHW